MPARPKRVETGAIGRRSARAVRKARAAACKVSWVCHAASAQWGWIGAAACGGVLSATALSRCIWRANSRVAADSSVPGTSAKTKRSGRTMATAPLAAPLRAPPVVEAAVRVFRFDQACMAPPARQRRWGAHRRDRPRRTWRPAIATAPATAASSVARGSTPAPTSTKPGPTSSSNRWRRPSAPRRLGCGISRPSAPRQRLRLDAEVAAVLVGRLGDEVALAHEAADLRQPHHQPRQRIAQQRAQRVDHRHEVLHADAFARHRRGVRAALALVAVEQRGARLAAQHRVELPAQVVGIAHAGVHALADELRRHVRGVAGQQHAAVAPALGHQRVEGVDQRAQDLELVDVDVLRQVVAHRVRVLHVFARLPRHQHELEAVVAVRLHAAHGRAGRVADEVEVRQVAQAVGRVLGLDVDHQPGVGEVLAGHGDAELRTHAAAPAVGTDEVAGAHAHRSPGTGAGVTPGCGAGRE